MEAFDSNGKTVIVAHFLLADQTGLIKAQLENSIIQDKVNMQKD